MKKQNKKPDFICPNCGSVVSGNANVCKECGSDAETGWAQNAEYSYLEPVFDKQDYEEITNNEFGTNKKKKPMDYMVPIVSVILLLLWLYYSLA